MNTTAFKKNEIYQLNITSQGSEGEGIGKIDSFAVFVKNAVVGDVLKVKLLKVNKSYAFGKIEQIITPSPYRQEPACKVYARCGGCNFMHIKYEQQLRLKKQRVFDALTRIGGIDISDDFEIIGADDPFYYRNKTQLPVGINRDGEVVTGFFAPKTHTICATDECSVAPHIQKSVADTVKQFMKAYNISPYNEISHQGIIRHIFIRTSKTGDVMVVIVANSKKPKFPDELVTMLKANIDNLVSVIWNINTDKTNLILGKTNITLYGTDTLTDTIGNLSFKISPLSFYQINSAQTEKLYKTALDFASLTGKESVFDLYCGIGTISLFLSQKAKKVFGLEITPEAVSDAKENAKLNNITNAHFICGAVENTLIELYNSGESADVVVLDPPRKGSDTLTLETIIKVNPKRIVYVSCNPETLARDAKFLKEMGGYKIVKIKGVDMFPNTNHVESVVLFQKNIDNVK